LNGNPYDLEHFVLARPYHPFHAGQNKHANQEDKGEVMDCTAFYASDQVGCEIVHLSG
jgi:hypothetical protein